MNSANAGDSEFEHPEFGPGLSAAPPVELNVLAAELNQESEPNQELNPEAWRSEVAARLARFRKRRKTRAPRYPSLHLPFDGAERVWFSTGRETKPASARDGIGAALSEGDGAAGASAAAYEPAPEVVAREFVAREVVAKEIMAREFVAPEIVAPEFMAKVIEFPRAAAIPVMHPTPLADPICDRPRIVEAPEIVPPAPALGGIMMEPVSGQAVERTIRAEAPAASASIPERVLAAMVDGVILMVSLCAIGGIFLRFNPVAGNPVAGLNPVSDLVSGPIVNLAATAAGLAIALWMAYEFLFLVATGSTPGLRALGLRLTKFDGSATDRRIRRWRVWAIFLSAFSAGLGFVWCFLDEDSLCWHDRITRTHIRSSQAKTK